MPFGKHLQGKETPMKRKASIVLLGILMHSAALAFEVNGVRSGMASNEVVTKLRQQGFVVTPLHQENSHIILVAERYGDMDFLDFCDGKLTRYSDRIAGNIRTYIRLVEQLTRQRGAGQYKAKVEVPDSEFLQLHSLEFSWVEGPDTIRVYYLADFDRKESITMTHFVTEAKCLKEKRE